MFAHERHERIAALAAAEGRVSVHELAELFDVTQETVRRDLDALEAEGKLRRVHGGAIAMDRLSMVEPSLSERQSQNQQQKQRIARAALRFLPRTSTASVILDAGTSTELLAEQLTAWAPAAAAEELLVITNAVPIAQRLCNRPEVSLEILGGRVRGLTSAAVGSGVIAQLQGLRPDIAFIGANGLHSRFGLSTPDALEAAVKTAMVQVAHRVVALVDSSKFEQETLVRFAALEAIDVLVTDQRPGAELAAALDQAGVDVVVA
ncbi:DeoR/GlpR family DNA-binding transcription regulator [Arthrobacter russicus]|uniref:Lactose phosphotransferase system repressor n=1 Tax=Arthrobacter russicus TaxID=172040 RepID=A0ABU1JAV0_9MICC|nr:DeoR/GlpR family DNA-binding transcription regulator [Arthrobacter russicus]MDN5668206.1 DeoR/GlpR family DNA-binding transcription regulator [Renibacterium salmoninarum]MDR6269553.1 DeoR family fructose operon transcriptional repressor [Arthrobacter russicus]